MDKQASSPPVSRRSPILRALRRRASVFKRGDRIRVPPGLWSAICVSCGLWWVANVAPAAGPDSSTPLRLAVFDCDVTPPVGSMMAYDPVRRVDELGLRCRGIALMGAGKPIVLCAVDWIGISNQAHDLFRATIAKAAGTSGDRVALHCLHQHDAPRCDFTAEQLLHNAGVSNLGPFETGFQRLALETIANSVSNAVQGQARPISHAAFGTAVVDRVASNRRLLGEDGKVRATRYTTCRDAAMRAEPEGTIDPELNCLVFYDGETAMASLTYYACHPQSYYRTGVPSPDFPGIARFIRGQNAPDTLHVHFNGAGGNIGAGKYNDGKKENRLALAGRMAAAMESAFSNAHRFPITASQIGWNVQTVALPPAPHLDDETLRKSLVDADPVQRSNAAADLAWLSRCHDGHEVELSCLSVGEVRVLHLPGELFVEYQLNAKKHGGNLNVAVAAYGDYGPGYVGTEIAYSQGGYEASPRASRVDKSVESVLTQAIHQLIDESR